MFTYYLYLVSTHISTYYESDFNIIAIFSGFIVYLFHKPKFIKFGNFIIWMKN